MTTDPIDKADQRWLEFHHRIYQQLQEGTQWWGRGSFQGEFASHTPRMHILTSITRTGKHGDALYTARCGYEFKFSRILIETPKAPKRPPHTLIRCLNCLKD